MCDEDVENHTVAEQVSGNVLLEKGQGQDQAHPELKLEANGEKN